MKMIILGVLFLSIIANTTFAQTDLKKHFEDVNTFFSENAMYSKVRYREIKENPREFNKLISFIEKADLSECTAAEEKAFYINTYNLLVIKTTIDNYPLNKPTEVDGFFDKMKHTVCGKTYTLNTLEKKELLNKYKDPRLHFVLVCAAISCPPIANFAYKPEELEKQLDKRTKEALNNALFIQYDEFAGKANISEIFKWYADEFDKDIKKFINRYRTNPLPEDTQIGYYTYNWNLNDGSLSTSTKKKRRRN